MQLTFGDCNSVVRANGYACAPMDATGAPFGPVQLMQLPYDPTIYRDAPACILASVAQARSALDPYPSPQDVALVVVTTRTGLDMDKIFEKFIGKAVCPTRVLPDRSTVRIFARSDEGNMPWPPMHTDASPIGSIRIESFGALIPLGSPDEWRNGVNPINTQRSKLAKLDADKSMKLLQAVSAKLNDAMPPYVPPAPRVIEPTLKPGDRMLFANERLITRLERNGFRPRPYPSASKDAGIVLLAKAAPRTSASFDMYGAPVVQRGLAAIEIRSERPEIIQACESLMGADGKPVVRVAADGTRLYLHRCEGGPPMRQLEGMRGFGSGKLTWFRITAQEPVVLSAALDESDYQWPGTDWCEIKYEDLPLFDYGLGQRIARTIEELCL